MCVFFFIYLHHVFNRLNPTYDQALNNLGNLMKVRFEPYFMIPVVCWNCVFSDRFTHRWFQSRIKKKSDHVMTNISWPKFAAQLFQSPQMYQVRGKSCPRHGFCICRTFLCNTSWIVYYFHCLLGLGKGCATLWPPYLKLKFVSMSFCLSAITQLLLSRQLSDWTKSIGNCSYNYVKMCVFSIGRSL